jgi:flavin-dependent dehydrogenase
MGERFMADPYVLEDGARIAVIGGGPSGSFFSIFALRMAKMAGKRISLIIYEPKDFRKDGPAGCNRCGGIISELLVQTLAVEGISLPDTVVQRGIDSYNLHTNHGSVYISSTAHEKTIATVYRGGGPKGITGKGKESFDNFLLALAIHEGAEHKSIKIDRIEYKNQKPVLFSKGHALDTPDLVAGAIGVKSQTSKLFEDMGFGYKRPETVTAAIMEIEMNSDSIAERFGNSVHLFLLPIKDVKFAAMIPKGTYVTVCMLGKNLNQSSMNEFIDNEVVRTVLPKSLNYTVGCRCLPKMNVKAAKVPFTDRVVLFGDAGSSRLFKDGLGAAYIMGKAAAKTAVLYGVSKEHFRNEYYPVYQSLIIDNWFGEVLFTTTDVFKRYRPLTKSMLKVVQQEQQDSGDLRRLSSILWDMFTGNERYKDIFRRAVDVPLFVHLLKHIPGSLLRRDA